MGEEEVSTNDAFKGFAAKKSRGATNIIFCLSGWLQGEPPHILYKCRHTILYYSGILFFYEVDLDYQHRTLEPDEIVKFISVNLPPNKGFLLIILIKHFLYTI